MSKHRYKDSNTLLMKCLSGSRAYGTSTPESDTDIRGIFMAPKESIVTPYFPIKEMVLPGEEDGKLYELNNFMKLFTDQNPNILELVFVEREDVIETSPAYELIRKEAPGLLSKKTAFTFSGYAISQLKRIKGHNKWINNPEPVEQPTQREYLKLVHNYTDIQSSVVSGNLLYTLDRLDRFCVFVPYGNNIFGVIVKDLGGNDRGLFNRDGTLRLTNYDTLTDEDKQKKPLYIIRYLAEDHRLSKDRHHNYWHWYNNRNPTRHELEVKYGFDCKAGQHVVRLLRMSEEILTEGTVNVRRKDAQELLAIRNGAWSYEYMLEWATEKDELIRGKLYRESTLPKSCDIHKAAELLMEIQDMYWR